MRALVADLNATMIPLTPREFQFQLDRRADGRSTLTTVRGARRDRRQCRHGVARRTMATASGEVKRMFTLPEVRGQRVGSQLLQRIEELAREKGHFRLVLETGEAPASRPAYRVYERGGFTVCGAVLDYPDSGIFPLLRKRRFLHEPSSTGLTIAEARDAS